MKVNSIRKITTTHTWNIQQECIAQRLDLDCKRHILYNDIRQGKYCLIVLNIETGVESVLPMLAYTVSVDGKIALLLDFSRLYSLRLGYGYAVLLETIKGEALPNNTAIWRMDIEIGEVVDILKYVDFENFQPRLWTQICRRQ